MCLLASRLQSGGNSGKALAAKRGRLKDGHHPGWVIVHNGRARTIDSIPNELGLDVFCRMVQDTLLASDDVRE